jgi:acetyl esterase
VALKSDAARYLRELPAESAFPRAALIDPQVASQYLRSARRRGPASTAVADPACEVWETEVRSGVPARVYVPQRAQPAPLVVYLHGGGWVLGDLDTHDDTCRRIATGGSCTVVNVGYRLAPENPYPIPLEDCFAAVSWSSEHSADLSADPGAIVVAGSSAGGNLAAAVTLMARAAGAPQIAGQILIYPVIDPRMDTESYRLFGSGYGLDRDQMKWFWSSYVPDERARHEPLVAPCLSESLAGLPPALVITAEFDPLRDEGEQYARALRAAGVRVKLHRYEGQIHGFVPMRGVLADADAALNEILTTIAQLRRVREARIR